MFGKIRKYAQKHKVELIILLLVLLVASYFRLYRISDYMTFLGDEGRDAIVAKDILRGDLTLLGPRASAGDFFLGPIYYYMMAPFLLLTNYDPVGPAIMVALFGIAAVFLIYHVGKKMFGSQAGLIAAALYAVSPVVVAYSRSSWNPNPMPFFSLLILYLSYVAVKEKRFAPFVAVGFLLGIAMQLHYLSTFLAVIIFVFVLGGEYMNGKKMILTRLIYRYLAIFGGFMIGFSAFLLFEIRHGFPNLKTIFSFILGGSGADKAAPNYSFLGNIWDVFFRLFARLVTKYPPPEQVNITENIHLQVWMVLTLLLSVAAIVYLFKVKDRLKILLFGTWLLLGVVLFGFYKKAIYDYYLVFMFPLPFLLVGNLFSRLLSGEFKKYVGVVIACISIIVLFLLNISGSPFWYPANKQKDQAKTIANFVLEKTGGKPFNFALLTRGNSDHVYRYFFETANRAPVTIENPIADPRRKSVTDQLLIVCEYQECQPLGNPLWEVAGFGRAQISGEWSVSFVKVYRLTHYLRSPEFDLSSQPLDATYERNDLGFSFKYPESFILTDNTDSPYYKDEKPYLRIHLITPSLPAEDQNKPGFDLRKYNDNSISIYLTVLRNDKNLNLRDFMTMDMSEPGKDGKPIIGVDGLQGLIVSNVPKDNSFVFEGLSSAGQSKKSYFFANQNYVYYLTMIRDVDTGRPYTAQAEKLLEQIIGSIKFK